MKLNNKGFAITTILYGTLILFLLLLVSMLGILASYNGRLGMLIDSNNGARCIINGNCIGDVIPNAPVLDDGMIPVVISDNGTVTVVSYDDPNWYDYKNKRWANAVLVDEEPREEGRFSIEGTVIPLDHILAYYVWIPRYKYKLFSEPVASGNKRYEQSIEIVFETDEQKSSGTSVGQYLTHPAFTFGDEELSGIWVGKFETTGDDSYPTILPNAEANSGDNVSTQFLTSLNFAGGRYSTQEGDILFEGNRFYGLTSNTDSHMMKNSEWGAVAYLSHSKYGINSEVYPNDGDMTGCGSSSIEGNADSPCAVKYGEATSYLQSTTGNITGVFDMSGGTAEYVMGNYNKYSGVAADSQYNSGFSGSTVDGDPVVSSIVFPESKYYDLYSLTDFGFPDKSSYVSCKVDTCGGHALYETSGWYDNFAQFVSIDGEVWFARGYFSTSIEYKAGIFNFSKYNGDGSNGYMDYTWRSVLVTG